MCVRIAWRAPESGLLGPAPRASGPVGVAWGPGGCTSDHLMGAAEAAAAGGSGPRFGERLIQAHLFRMRREARRNRTLPNRQNYLGAEPPRKASPPLPAFQER